MWAVYPELVHTQILPTLKSTDFELDDLMEWRKGREHAKRKTPLGYLGDPASSDPELGARMMAEQAEIVADAIAAKVKAAA
jgi:creatinine amidohydrolase